MSIDTRANAVSSAEADMARRLEMMSNRTSLTALDALLRALPVEGGSLAAAAGEGKAIAEHVARATEELAATVKVRPV
jgi:hypothetical protein